MKRQQHRRSVLVHIAVVTASWPVFMEVYDDILEITGHLPEEWRETGLDDGIPLGAGLDRDEVQWII